MSDEEYQARENTYWKYKAEKLKVSTSLALYVTSVVTPSGIWNLLHKTASSASMS